VRCAAAIAVALLGVIAACSDGSSSSTSTRSSSRLRQSSYVSAPACGAPRLSATVSTLSSLSGLPDAKLRNIESAPSGSTPNTCACGCIHNCGRYESGIDCVGDHDVGFHHHQRDNHG